MAGFVFGGFVLLMGYVLFFVDGGDGNKGSRCSRCGESKHVEPINFCHRCGQKLMGDI